VKPERVRWKYAPAREGAGVSVAAVSRYLGGSLLLPPETASRIDSAVRSLNYQPNPHARRLSRGRSDVIGLVIPDIANPFFARIAAEIEISVDSEGYGLVLCITMNRPGREIEYLDKLRRNYVDGLIFMTNHTGDAKLAKAINDAGLVVLVDEDIRGTSVHKIFCDNEEGGYLATRHLLEAGHRRIAFVGGPKSMLTTRERLAGYRRAIRESGPDASSIAELFGEYTIEHGRAAAKNLISHVPHATGVFFTSDEVLLGGLEVLEQHGQRIPSDVSVVTFDDVEPLHLFTPPITAVRQPLAEIGRRSVQAVIFPDHRADLPMVERLPVSLIVRASVAPPSAQRRRGRVLGR
jgi:LacI family transcriptional regulator